MPSFSRFSTAAALAALLVALTGCTPGGPARPDPADIVRDYLAALAEGDAATARAIDSEAVSETLGSNTDADGLRTDAVLGAAETISNIRIEARTTPADAESTRVGFSYDLAGETRQGSLAVAWDSEAGEWELAEPFTLDLGVNAVVSSIEIEPVPFTIGETPVELGAAPDEAPIFHLVYPGVYTITADIDPATVTDGEGLTRTVVAVPPDGVEVDYQVSRLPSS